MKKFKLPFFYLYVLCLFSFRVSGQCPEIRFIMVDACTGSGTERDNEFFVISSGAGFPVDDLGFETPTGTVSASSSDNDDFFNINPCPSCLSGCNIVFITNGDSVPANRNVAVFTSRNLNFLTYDLSGLCTGGEIYVLVANATPGTGQFANYSPANCSGCNPTNGDPLRTTTLTLTNGCASSAVYHRCHLRNLAGNCAAQDGGAVIFIDGMDSYNNNGCSAPSLPVVFDKFAIKQNKGTVQLMWATTLEINNDFFTVERSDDAVNFLSVGIIQAAGNSHQVTEYEWIDRDALAGIFYYRIKQTDFDGRFDYSDIQYIAVKGTHRDFIISQYQNMLTVSSGETPYSVSVVSVSGNHLEKWDNLLFEKELDLDHLPSGIYFIRINNDVFSQTKKVLIWR